MLCGDRGGDQAADGDHGSTDDSKEVRFGVIDRYFPDIKYPSIICNCIPIYIGLIMCIQILISSVCILMSAVLKISLLNFYIASK